jgi:hypothetical protein
LLVDGALEGVAEKSVRSLAFEMLVVFTFPESS